MNVFTKRITALSVVTTVFLGASQVNAISLQNVQPVSCYIKTDGTISMHRLYNPNSGEHFYTGNEDEARYLNQEGWNHEGIAWLAPVDGQAVYRMYNPNAGDHHYTVNTFERDMLIQYGWKYEGIAFYSYPDSESGFPMYRQYNPNAKSGAHNYTSDLNERSFLIRNGWKDENIAWFAHPDSSMIDHDNNMPGWTLYHRKDPGSKPVKNPTSLQILDFGYTLNYGCIDYGLILHNGYSNYAARFSAVTVRGIRPDGSILFSDTSFFRYLDAGTTGYYAGRAGYGDVTSDVRIEISVSTGVDNWIKTKGFGPSPWRFSNISYIKDSYGGRVTGEITLTRPLQVAYWDAKFPMISCIFVNQNGKVTSGDYTYIAQELVVGKKETFEIYVNNPGDFQSMEIGASF